MKVLLRLDEEDIDFLLALVHRNERDHEVKGKSRYTVIKQVLEQALKLKEWNKIVSND